MVTAAPIYFIPNAAHLAGQTLDQIVACVKQVVQNVVRCEMDVQVDPNLSPSDRVDALNVLSGALNNELAGGLNRRIHIDITVELGLLKVTTTILKAACTITGAVVGGAGASLGFIKLGAGTFAVIATAAGALMLVPVILGGIVAGALLGYGIACLVEKFQAREVKIVN